MVWLRRGSVGWVQSSFRPLDSWRNGGAALIPLRELLVVVEDRLGDARDPDGELEATESGLAAVFLSGVVYWEDRGWRTTA